MWSAEAIHNSIHYIEANPVRAGLVQKPEERPWSSARARALNEGLVPDQKGVPEHGTA